MCRAGQTPHGARPNREEARCRRASFRPGACWLGAPNLRVGRLSRAVMRGPEEWPSPRTNPPHRIPLTRPTPIPGGLPLLGLGGPLFHVFLPAPAVEPCTISNFNGFVGWAAVGGMGTRTVTGQAPEHLPFESDVRFMSGEFVGADGRNHHGAFAFI